MPAEWREKLKAERIDVVPVPGQEPTTLLVLWIDIPPETETRDQTALLEEAAHLGLAHARRQFQGK